MIQTFLFMVAWWCSG